MDRIFDLILWNIGSWKIPRKSISFCPMGPWAWLQKPKSCHYWLWGQCCPDCTCNWYLNLTQKFKFQFWYLPPFEDLLSWKLTDFANHISHFLTMPPLMPLFIYSEKAKNFAKYVPLGLSYVVPVKSTVEILKNFVASSEYMNFAISIFSPNKF